MLLREKKTGHINQVEGLGEILAELLPCDVERIDVRPRWWAHSVVRQLLLALVDLKRPSSVRWAIRAVYGRDPATLEKASFVIGSGRPTIALGIWLRSSMQAPLVFSGYARGPKTDLVDLQLVNSPRLVGNAKFALTPVPGIINGARYGEPKPIRSAADLEGASVGLMIGGNSHAHKYSRADWERLIAFIAQMHAKHGVRWSVSTSRRSPDVLGPQLQALTERGAIENFIDYRQKGRATAGAVFGADLLFVTEDSLSMMSEALEAGRPVVALRAGRSRHSEMTEVISYQAGQGWMVTLPMAHIDDAMLLRELAALTPPRWSARQMIKRRIAFFVEQMDLRDSSPVDGHATDA